MAICSTSGCGAQAVDGGPCGAWCAACMARNGAIVAGEWHMGPTYRYRLTTDTGIGGLPPESPPPAAPPATLPKW